MTDVAALFGGGGTDCSIPLREAGVLPEWQRFVANQTRLQPQAQTGGCRPKLVCIDIQPYDTTQAPDRDDILNIGGFNDAVFNVVSAFLEDDASRFVQEVESIEL